MKHKKELILLAVILALASLLRFVDLNKLPIELFGDEVDAGYHAYSVLKTGRDYRGNFLPLTFASFAEPRLPLFIYSLVPGVALFGPNELGVRVPVAFWGVVSIAVFCLLLKALFDSPTALVGSLIMTITPWHIHYSRGGFENALLLSLVLLGTVFWLRAPKRWFFLPLSFLAFGLSFITYSSAYGFVPLLIVALAVIFPPRKISRLAGVSAVLVAAVAIVLVIFSWRGGQSQNRLDLTGIFTSSQVVDETAYKRSLEPLPILGTIFDNRYVITVREVVDNYFAAFSPQFLATSGDPNPAHSEIGGGFGELWHWEYLAAIIGVAILFLGRKNGSSRLTLVWLFLAPVSSAVTEGGGDHATRLFLMLPALVVAASIGTLWFVKAAQKSRFAPVVMTIFLVVCLSEAILFFHHYVVAYRVESWRAWQYGYKEAVQALPKTGVVFVSYQGEPALARYLFWSAVSPSWFQANFSGDKFQTNLLPGFDGFRVGGNLYFGNLQSGVTLEKFLPAGATFMAIQGKDIPGDWDWQVSPPKGFKVTKEVKDPQFGQPIIVDVARP